MTYRGLYNEDGCAMFPNGLAITPQSFIPPRIRCRLPCLCIINIYLVGDRTTDNEVADMAELGRQGADYDKIMVFICTHSDETRGDLFFEPNGAVTVNDHLLDPLKKKEITMFLLACGAILHDKESSHDLKTAVSTFNIKNCFTFTSQMLLAYEIFPFVQGYAHAAVRQGRDSEADLEQLLDQCFSVGLHTNFVWFMPGKLPSGAQCQATVTVINDMNLGPVQRGHKGVWMIGIL
ncbi:hypothetical protein BC835DRAFT_1309725 [Cytidiella melzeri]|nr:hypothetical protein BC835DRAFT_1309725 [Cytidiella melzeri]